MTLVAATAHRRAHRELARSLAPRFVEVHVATPPEECARRDPKGLHAAVRAGRASEVPGVDVAYEAPGSADVVAAGGEDAAAVEQVVALARGGR